MYYVTLICHNHLRRVWPTPVLSVVSTFPVFQHKETATITLIFLTVVMIGLMVAYPTVGGGWLEKQHSMRNRGKKNKHMYLKMNKRGKTNRNISLYIYIYIYIYMCVCVCWCNGYHRKKLNRRPEFKSRTSVFTWHYPWERHKSICSKGE